MIVWEKVIKDVCSPNGEKYDPAKHEECYIRFDRRPRSNWYRPEQLFHTRKEANLSLAVKMREQAKSLIKQAEKLETE